jgi:membrane protein CcdC involved in cytochrome C biogenesis
MEWTFNATTFSSDSFKGGQMPVEFFFLIAIIIVLLQLRTRRVRLLAIWILPAILLPITAATIGVDYGGPGTLLLSVVGFIIGCGAGFLISSNMKMAIDERGRILLKGSLIAVTIWILVLGVKMFGKGIIGDMGIISLNDLTSMAFAITLGTIITRRIYITLKYFELKKQTTEGTGKPVP